MYSGAAIYNIKQHVQNINKSANVGLYVQYEQQVRTVVINTYSYVCNSIVKQQSMQNISGAIIFL